MSTTTDLDTTTTDEWRPPPGSFLGDTWANSKRWIRKFVRQPAVLAGMIFQPIAWIVLFTEVFEPVVQLPGFESESYLAFFLPAVLLFMTPFVGLAVGINLVLDIENGMFDKVLTTPVSRTAVFLGKSLADLLRIVIQSVIILVLGYAVGARIEAGVLGALGMIGVALLLGVFFISFSTIIGLYTQNHDALQTVLQALIFPLMFLSSAFLPLKLLPGWVQFVAMINPLTYGIDAARAIMVQGWAWDAILPGVGVLIVLDLVFGAGAVVMLNRTITAR